MRVQMLEEELQSRIVDNEDVHQMNKQVGMERKMMVDRIEMLEEKLRDRERLISELSKTNKELTVNLHIEQE